VIRIEMSHKDFLSDADLRALGMESLDDLYSGWAGTLSSGPIWLIRITNHIEMAQADAPDTISVAEFAEMHNLSANRVNIILRADLKLPADQRRIPGAYKVGSKFRGEWRIPRATAEALERDPRGKPRR
jgi:hypothetical protein